MARRPRPRGVAGPVRRRPVAGAIPRAARPGGPRRPDREGGRSVGPADRGSPGGAGLGRGEWREYDVRPGRASRDDRRAGGLPAPVDPAGRCLHGKRPPHLAHRHEGWLRGARHEEVPLPAGGRRGVPGRGDREAGTRRLDEWHRGRPRREAAGRSVGRAGRGLREPRPLHEDRRRRPVHRPRPAHRPGPAPLRRAPGAILPSARCPPSRRSASSTSRAAASSSRSTHPARPRRPSARPWR